MYDVRGLSSKNFLPDRWLHMVFRWKVLAPFIFVVAVCVASASLSGSDYPFLKTAARGDLLLLSALILMEAAFELRRVESPLKKLPTVFVIIILSFYALLKLWEQGRAEAAGDLNARLLLALVIFNCAVTLCSVVGSLYLFMIVAREAAAKRLSEFAPAGPRQARANADG